MKRGNGVPLRRIRALVLDVDGVLTDGSLTYGPRGEALKSFHVRDGRGMKLALDAGIQLAVISGRRFGGVAARCRELGVRHLQQGVDDKSAALDRLLAKLGLEPADVACIGDDTPDIPLFVRVGCAFAVADAHPLALAAAHRRTRQPGGRGAVREVCDLLLAARAGARLRA